MIWAETFSHFLWPEDLAEAIDEDPEEINMILRLATPILRAHGIIPREFRGRMAWCLVGIEPMYLTLSTRLLAHAMSAEPNGLLLRAVANTRRDRRGVELSDIVVEAIGHTCPVKEKAPVMKRKRTNVSGGEGSMWVTDDITPKSRAKRGNNKGAGNPRKKGKAAKKFALMPDHTSAGSNTHNNAELASEIKTGGEGGGRREAGVCAACLAAGVRRDFLLSNKHERKGPKICLAIQEKFREEGGHTSTTSDDSTSEDGSASDESSSEYDAGEGDTDC
ncbi:unnamed protein product [Ectocarpus sp. CCAP 1310/34]|nr:unnamed protein product [Ectocarpus sp. CCAP 1310/34]